MGRISACVCLWTIQDLSLEAACDRGRSVLLTSTVERTEVLPSLAEERYGAKESELNYHIEFSPNKTLEHVCGNEELCFCVRLICQWPPPNSCWLGRASMLLSMFAPPHEYYIKGNNGWKKESQNLFTQLGHIHRIEFKVMRTRGKKTLIKTQEDRNVTWDCWSFLIEWMGRKGIWKKHCNGCCTMW